MEMIIVLLILGLTVGIALPRIGAGWKRMSDREVVQDIVQTLKRARLRALYSGEVTVFRIRGADRLYGFELPLNHGIPDNVDIFADKLPVDPETRDNVILFYPDGSLTGSDLGIVFDRQRTFRISIHPLFGTVQFYEVQS